MLKRQSLRQYVIWGRLQGRGIVLWILGYFNHETSDEQWTMWPYTLMCTFLPVNAHSSNIQFHGFNSNFLDPPLPWQNCVILCPFAHPTNFKATKRKNKKTKHLNKPKPFILVCCSDGGILQVHTKLDVYFIFSASKCQGKLQVSCLFFVCCFYGENGSPLSLSSLPKVCKMPPS